MKNFIRIGSIAAVISLLFVACSNTEDPLNDGNEVLSTRAESPFIVTSPTEVWFNEVRPFREYRDTVNVKLAGLPSLATISSLRATFQGESAEYFEVEEMNLSLANIINALLGNGVNVPIVYKPREVVLQKPDSAELLIEVALLGLVFPVQTTVPVYGVAADPGPLLVSTVPLDNTDIRIEEKESLYGYHYLQFIFNEDIQATSDFYVAFGTTSNNPVLDSYTIEGRVLTLRIRTLLPTLGVTTAVFVSLSRGSVADLDGNPTQVSYDLTYRAG